MLLWLVLALLTGSAVGLVLWPLGRPSKASDEGATDTAFYQAQVAEIERDAQRGLLAPEEAESSRTEAGRRLLASARREAEASIGTPLSSESARRRWAAALTLVFVPALSLMIYLWTGSPNAPDQPLASRAAPLDETDMARALAEIEAHLAQNPNDGRGYEVVAPVYLQLGRGQDAAKAYRNAMRILGETPQRLADFAEALIVAGEGIVSAEARAALDKALAGDKTIAKARFYRAQSYDQDGEREKALALYRSLEAEAPPGSGLAGMLADRITKLGGAPSDQAATIAAMPEADRDAMIRSMVAGLSARLTDNGADVDGWMKLMRSYVVLGEPAKAVEALDRARAALAGDSAGRERVEALARDLKIGG
jgi:cytochrome c-type biogenesis protein CcmH